jgi:hypothetical protein
MLPIQATMLIPDLLRAAPQARPILDRYGLRGCGGKFGPVESLGFFAQAHAVPLDRLLDELRMAAGDREATPIPPTLAADGNAADTIYRPFFLAGISVVLTLGATWGAYLLWRISWQGSFGAAGLHEVNAHGHAQIFGWVGLFIMGFAYQAFPRFKHTDLALPRLAYLSLVLMLAGLLGRAGCEPLAAEYPWAGWAALSGSALEIVAVGLCAGILGRTWYRAGKSLASYDYYILAALVWFVVQAVYDAVYFAATVATTDPAELRWLIATWQGSLREVQIHGFALLMILGVSQRVFHHFYGLPAPSPRLSLAALAALNVAIIGESVGLVLMQLADRTWAVLWYGSVLLLAGTVALLVRDWHIFAPATEADRSLKFLRLAYVWLFVSLAMLVFVPGYQFGILPWLAPSSGAAQIGFSHAYYGATRHAITVGFISLMIVGMAAKVVPTLNGVSVHALGQLWGPFLLINLGCLLRVTAQTLTDFTPRAFAVTGISGTLETLGLAWWGGHLARIMLGWRHEGLEAVCNSQRVPAYVPGQAILPTHRVGDILDQWPGALETFLAFGFKPLANPLLRQRFTRGVTVRRACRFLGLPEAQLIGALEAAQARQFSRRRPLPLVQG